MVQYLRFVSFEVGLLLSLAALGDSLALAVGGMVRLTHNDDGTLRSGQGLQDKTRMVDANGNIWLRGRKMGMKEVNEVKVTVKTGANYSVGKCGHGGERVGCKASYRGNAEMSLNKSSWSSNIEKDFSFTTSQSGQSSILNMRSSEGNVLEPVNLSNSLQITSQVFKTRKLLVSTAGIFKMLQKDYHERAHRRPPINNHQPLASIHVKP